MTNSEDMLDCWLLGDGLDIAVPVTEIVKNEVKRKAIEAMESGHPYDFIEFPNLHGEKMEIQAKHIVYFQQDTPEGRESKRERDRLLHSEDPLEDL